MASFILSFDKDSRKYVTGETVHCKVQVNVRNKFKARSLTLEWVGKARTNLTSGKTNYITQVELFRVNKCLQGIEQGEAVEILPGCYEYYASYTLPLYLPSSNKHEYGSILYSVTANYDIPMWFDESKKEYFDVRAQLNLCRIPILAEPFKKIKEKTFGCLWCRTAPVQLILNLPKRGYIPGEDIPITIEVDNNSNVPITTVKVKLMEMIKFMAIRSGEVKAMDFEINTLMQHTFDTTVEPFQNKLFQTSFRLDPSYHWKLFNNCQIITCDYTIEVEAMTKGCHLNPSLDTKIIIGTVGALNANTDPVTMNEDNLPTYDQVVPCTSQ